MVSWYEPFDCLGLNCPKITDFTRSGKRRQSKNAKNAIIGHYRAFSSNRRCLRNLGRVLELTGIETEEIVVEYHADTQQQTCVDAFLAEYLIDIGAVATDAYGKPCSERCLRARTFRISSPMSGNTSERLRLMFCVRFLCFHWFVCVLSLRNNTPLYTDIPPPRDFILMKA